MEYGKIVELRTVALTPIMAEDIYGMKGKTPVFTLDEGPGGLKQLEVEEQMKNSIRRRSDLSAILREMARTLKASKGRVSMDFWRAIQWLRGWIFGQGEDENE